MRLWIGARIPFTPVRMGVSTRVGGRRGGASAGWGLLLLAIVPLYLIAQIATANALAAWLIVGGLIGLVVLFKISDWLEPPKGAAPAGSPAKWSNRR